MFHWFNFSYIDAKQSYTSVQIGFDSKNITMQCIEASKAKIDNKEVCLLAVSYLGFMTEADFNKVDYNDND